VFAHLGMVRNTRPHVFIEAVVHGRRPDEHGRNIALLERMLATEEDVGHATDVPHVDRL